MIVLCVFFLSVTSFENTVPGLLKSIVTVSGFDEAMTWTINSGFAGDVV